MYILYHKGSPRVLEWVAYPFFNGSIQPRNWTGVSCFAGGFFTNWAIREVLYTHVCVCVCVCVHIYIGFPRWLSSKELFCQCSSHRKCGFDSWVGKIPWRRKRQLQYSCLENPMDRGATWTTVHGVAKSQMWLNNWAYMSIYILTHTCTHMYIYSTSLNNSLGRYLINNLLI